MSPLSSAALILVPALLAGPAAVADCDRADLLPGPRIIPSPMSLFMGPADAADYDGDGDLDVVGASWNGDEAFLRIDNGPDAEPSIHMFAANESLWTEIRMVDLDGNGVADLVMDHAGGISVYLDSAGGFDWPGDFYPTGGSPYGITWGDLDGDGILDLVSALTDGRLAVMRGIGDGTFAPAEHTVVGGSLWFAVLGDLDLDGDLDVAVPNNAFDEIGILLNDGLGNFTIATPVDTGPSTTQAAIADLNGDGLPDLVASRWDTTDSVSVHLGTGGGAFVPGPTYDIQEPYHMRTWDGNGDGATDIVLGTWNGVLWSLVNQGDGTLEPQGPFGGALWIYTLVRVGDADGDGNQDLFTTSHLGVGVVSGRGDGTFDAPGAHEAREASAVALEDFNGDGRLDIATSSFGLHGPSIPGVSIILATEDGYAPAQFYPVGPDLGDNHFEHGILANDLDGDGHADLVLADLWYDTMFVLLGLGDGTFAPEVAYATGPRPRTIKAGDLDEDGTLDLVVAGWAVEAVDVFRGNGDGTFAPRESVVVGSEVALVVDLDDDGHLDIVAMDPQESGFARVLGNGDGTFGARSFFLTELFAFQLAAGDFDGDGIVDVAMSNTEQTVIRPGIGDGAFGEPQTAEFGAVGATFGADLDGDGYDDLVLVNARSTTEVTFGTAVLFGSADGLAESQFYESSDHIGAAGDMNGDGAIDLVVTRNRLVDQVSQVVEVRLNQCPGAPACPADIDGDGAVAIGDLLLVLINWGGPGGDVDGDGMTDIVDLLAVLLAWGPCSS